MLVLKPAMIPVLLVLAGLAPAWAQAPVYVSPSTWTDPGVVIEPTHVVRYFAGAYSTELVTPGLPKLDALDAVHRMDAPGQFLVSTGLPKTLVTLHVEPRDVARGGGAAYFPFFDGGSVPAGLPASANIDAVFLDGSDADDLIVSFDSPLELPPGSGAFYEPNDLARFKRIGPGPGNWMLVGHEFVGSAAGIPPNIDIVGADREFGGNLLLTFGATVTLPTSGGPVTFVNGDVVSWDGALFGLSQSLPSWQRNTQVDALSCQANPGGLENNLITVDRSVTPGDIVISWAPSCSAGADDYGIYEGTIGSFYSHTLKDCSDDFGDFTETVTPAAASSYYLVVPLSDAAIEGSYGTSSAGAPRPLGTATCVPTRVIAACP